MENLYTRDPLPGFDDDAVASFPEDEALPEDSPDETRTAGATPNCAAPPDPELDIVHDYFRQRSASFGPSIRQALDEVIAAGRTRRWNLDQCNNQEKAYVGVN